MDGEICNQSTTIMEAGAADPPRPSSASINAVRETRTPIIGERLQLSLKRAIAGADELDQGLST
jgi:hypothetical protein